MSAISRIQWTDRTWNPVRGCSVVSPGCVNCYAMKQAHRFSGTGRAYEGLTKPTKAGPQWTGQIRTVESALLEPLSWRQPAKVFVNSMSDLFHDAVPDDFIARVFATMAWARHHTFQVLTKRADRMQDLVASEDFRSEVAEFVEFLLIEDPEPHRFFRVDPHARRTDDARATQPDLEGSDWPLRNVWLGVSAEDQQRADERIPLLLQTPASVRFVSAEPLLRAIDLSFLRHAHVDTPRLDWLIVGGESGPKARPCWVPHLRSLVRQCRHAGVPVFVKQLGSDVRDRNDAGFEGCEPHEWPEFYVQDNRIEHDLDGTRDGYQGAPVRIHLIDRKGGDPAEWPRDVRVRQFPESRLS